MNFGFLIDNRLCIGCHACSTACKQENSVPLGVNRTWVKYVEKGAFPHARRHFQVTRCNHCANPPCVRICPVEAMYQRSDGIVDFDKRVCIGCKACLQACPYDAIYVDPDHGTAAKCHYCAHRVEVGLEPACVVVCPEQAIVSGNLDDPQSKLSQLVARHPVSVRRPEQGTAPKLFYLAGEAVSLTPGAARLSGSYLWADVATDQAQAQHAADGHARAPDRTTHTQRPSGATVRTAGAQSVGSWAGPIYVGETRVAEQMVQTAYNAQHNVPWHWPVPAYLVTKAVASGLMMMLMYLFWFGPGVMARELALGATLTSLVFTGLTTILLVLDLERPERFLYILTRPQWQSWLTRGAFILMAFAAVTSLWFLLEAGVYLGWLPSWLSQSLAGLFVTAAGLLGIGTAAYTAFLFGQAEGRDLWQSPLLPLHLVVQALMAGAAVLLILLSTLDLVFAVTSRAGEIAFWVLMATLLVDLAILLVGEMAMPHASETAARAAHDIRSGRYRRSYQLGTITVGHILPIFLLALFPLGVVSSAPAAVAFGVVACLLVLAGLYAYEHAFVMAPQEIPNS